jgi:hypothetical protein
MAKLFCDILVLALMAGAAANAGEQPTFEARKRDAAGELRPVQIPFCRNPKSTKVVLTFQAPESGTYVFIYTNGPDKGKVAKIISVAEAGPVTADVPTRAQKD